MKLDVTELAMAHVDGEKRNVYLGANVANMGIPQQVQGPEPEQVNNVVVGVRSGNLVNGMEGNVIIGNNVMNVNEQFREEQVFPGGRADSLAAQLRNVNLDTRFEESVSPVKGHLAIGMDGKTLLGGNFETGTLNLPPLSGRHASAVKQLSAKANGVAFSRLNIVQVMNDNVEADECSTFWTGSRAEDGCLKLK